MPETSLPTLRRVWSAFACAVFVAMSAVGTSLLYQHRRDPDIQTVAVRVVLDSLPFLASIAFALWPQVSRAHIGFRVVIVIGGLLWSGLLGRKDYLDIQQSRKERQADITTAVAEANKHTDDQMRALRTDLDKDLDNRFGSLGKEFTTGLSGLKPPPPQFAALKFKFFDSDQSTIDMHGLDGVFTLDFTAVDTTDVAANSIDAWVEICGGCSFVKEPSGFDRPAGILDQVRHLKFNALNPGTYMSKMTLDVKAPRGPWFEVKWRYSCASCGKQGDPQQFRVNVLEPYKPNVLPPKLN